MKTRRNFRNKRKSAKSRCRKHRYTRRGGVGTTKTNRVPRAGFAVRILGTKFKTAARKDAEFIKKLRIMREQTEEEIDKARVCLATLGTNVDNEKLEMRKNMSTPAWQRISSTYNMDDYLDKMYGPKIKAISLQLSAYYDRRILLDGLMITKDTSVHIPELNIFKYSNCGDSHIFDKNDPVNIAALADENAAVLYYKKKKEDERRDDETMSW